MARQGSIWTLLALMAMLLVASSPAHAQDPEQEKVVSQGTTVTKIATAARAGEKCKARKAERWGKNAIGHKVIRFFQTVKWCWTKSRITYTKRRNAQETPGFVWDFKGFHNRYVDKSRTPGRWARFVGSGRFSLCIGGSIGTCIQNKTYTIRQSVFRGGGYKVDTSG